MDLRTRAIKSTAWYAGTRVWSQLLSWAVTIVLARLLAPADYGLLGMALSVISFLEIFHELGLGTVIVQRQDLTREQINTIFWVVTGISLLTASVAFASAPAIAHFYDEARLVWIVRALALILLVNALGLVSYNLLTKAIDFRRRSLGEGAGVCAATTTALTLAYLGHGVWALVFGELARTVVRNAVLVALCGWRPGLDCSWGSMRSAFTFGANVVGSTVVGHFTSVLNTAVLGRLLGVTALGLFSMSSNLATNSFQKLSTVIVNQLSFPVFSQVQDDADRLRRYFLTVSKYSLVVTLPLQIGLLLVARDFVSLVLSERWMGIVALVQLQCLGAVWGILGAPAGTALNARGRADVMFRFSLISSVLSVGGCAGAAPYGITIVVAVWAATHCATRTYLVRLALRELSLPVAEYVRVLGSPIVAALVMVVGVLAVRSVLPVHDAAISLARDVAMGAAAYAGTLLLMDRALGLEVRAVLRALAAEARA